MLNLRHRSLAPGLPFVPEWTTTTRLRTRLDAWRRLAGHAIEPNPFYEPEYLLASADHVTGDEIRCLAIYRDAGRDADLVGLFPLARARLMQGALLPALEFYSNPYICSTAPLIDRDAAPEVWHCFFEALRRTDDMPKVLLALQMASLGGAFLALEQAMRSEHLNYAVIDRFARAAVRCSASEEAYLATMSSGRRKELRRKLRRLSELGAIEFKIVTDPADKPAALAAFLALEQSGWKARTGTALACTPETRAFAEQAFLSEISEIDVLTLDGQPLAMTVNLVRDEAMFAVKTAYDEKYSSFSPGVHLDMWTVKKLFSPGTPYSRIDSCAIPGHPIEAVWTDKEPIISLALATRPEVTQARIDQFTRLMVTFNRLKTWVKEQIGSRTGAGDGDARPA